MTWPTAHVHLGGEGGGRGQSGDMHAPPEKFENLDSENVSEAFWQLFDIPIHVPHTTPL